LGIIFRYLFKVLWAFFTPRYQKVTSNCIKTRFLLL